MTITYGSMLRACSGDLAWTEEAWQGLQALERALPTRLTPAQRGLAWLDCAQNAADRAERDGLAFVDFMSDDGRSA